MMSFGEKYKKDNEKLKASEGSLASIIDKYKEQPFELSDKEVSEVKKSKSKIIKMICAAAAAFVLVGASVFAAINLFGTEPKPLSGTPIPTVQTGNAEMDNAVKTGSIQVSEDYDELYQVIMSQQYRNFDTGITGGIVEDGTGRGFDDFKYTADAETMLDTPAEEPMEAPMDVMAEEAPTANEEGGYDDYSETNTQVRGVDEGDIIKTDGKYIYTLSENTIRITSANNGEVQDLSSISFDYEKGSFPSEIYISENRLAVITTKYGTMTLENIDGNRDSSLDHVEQTSVIVYDTTDKSNPKVINTLSQSGYYLSSRLSDGYLYIVTNHNIYGDEIEKDHPETYVPAVTCEGKSRIVPAKNIVLYDDAQNSSYTVVTSIEIDNPTDHVSEAAVMDGSSEIYSDGEILLTASGTYIYEEGEERTNEKGEHYQTTVSTSKTVLTLFTLNNGIITQKASGIIPGMLLNQFSMDRYNGFYRFVTSYNSYVETIYTDGVDRYEYEDESSNALYTLDENLSILGKIENIAKDEMVQSVRFEGDLGYFVTFRQVDPLFAVDLSDPKNPKILSELKIPGFSQYLHRFDDGLLFGIGYDADEETGQTQGMKMSMFDTTDPLNVFERHVLKLDADYSEVSYNHKAILINKDRNIIAFPANSGYHIYGYDRETGFFEKTIIDIGGDWYMLLRGLFIGDYFYVCSDDGITSYHMPSFNEVDSVRWERAAYY